MRRAYAGFAALLSIAALGGCRDRTPARIVFDSDTITINTRFPNAAGAHALSQSGDTLPGTTLTYQVARDAAIGITRDGKVTCLRSGDEAVIVASGPASGRLTVRCRLVGHLQMDFGLSLPLGGAGQPLSVAAFDEQDRPMGNVRVGITVRDTNIVRLEHGMLTPVSLGRTYVAADAGGKAYGGMQVTVYEQILRAQPIAMATGASSSWKLAPGIYTLTLSLVSPDSAARVGVSWNGTYCGEKRPPIQSQLVCLVRPEADSPSLTIAAVRSPLLGSVTLSRSMGP